VGGEGGWGRGGGGGGGKRLLTDWMRSSMVTPLVLSSRLEFLPSLMTQAVASYCAIHGKMINRVMICDGEGSAK